MQSMETTASFRESSLSFFRISMERKEKSRDRCRGSGIDPRTPVLPRLLIQRSVFTISTRLGERHLSRLITRSITRRRQSSAERGFLVPMVSVPRELRERSPISYLDNPTANHGDQFSFVAEPIRRCSISLNRVAWLDGLVNAKCSKTLECPSYLRKTFRMYWSPLDAWHIFLACYLLPILGLKWRLPFLLNNWVEHHPLETIILAFSTPILTLAYTPPKSPIRLAVIPIIAASIIAFLQTADVYVSNKTIIAMASGPTTLLLLSSINYLCLQSRHLTENKIEGSDGIDGLRYKRYGKGEEFEHYSVKKKSQGPLSPLWWATDLIFNYRGVGTPREVKNLPQFSTKDPEYLPTRSRFLLGRILAVITSYLIIDCFNSLPPPDLQLFLEHKSYQLGGLTAMSLEDALTRVVTTIVFWISLRQTIALLYNTFSIIFVGLGFSDVEEWPPYFGSVFEAFSIRRFWRSVSL